MDCPKPIGGYTWYIVLEMGCGHAMEAYFENEPEDKSLVLKLQGPQCPWCKARKMYPGQDLPDHLHLNDAYTKGLILLQLGPVDAANYQEMLNLEKTILEDVHGQTQSALSVGEIPGVGDRSWDTPSAAHRRHGTDGAADADAADTFAGQPGIGDVPGRGSGGQVGDDPASPVQESGRSYDRLVGRSRALRGAHAKRVRRTPRSPRSWITRDDFRAAASYLAGSREHRRVWAVIVGLATVVAGACGFFAGKGSRR